MSFFRYISIYLVLISVPCSVPLLLSYTSTCADKSCGRTTSEHVALKRLIINEKEGKKSAP